MDTPGGVEHADRPSNEDPLRELFSTPTEFVSPKGVKCRYLSRSGGSSVYLYGDEHIIKHGERIQPSEAVAMRLVQDKTEVAIGYLFRSKFEPLPRDKSKVIGTLHMDIVPGKPLDTVWSHLTKPNKESLCKEIWLAIEKIRQIEKPEDIKKLDLYICLADGSLSHDPLIGSWDMKEMQSLPPMRTYNDVRNRIYDRYLFAGTKYNNGVLLEMLPKYSTGSVFTHCDISPRNIMVDVSEDDPHTYEFIASLDWEFAGWFPHYWEYVNIFKPGNATTTDWQAYMEASAPPALKCDLQGFRAARVVLF